MVRLPNDNSVPSRSKGSSREQTAIATGPVGSNGDLARPLRHIRCGEPELASRHPAGRPAAREDARDRSKVGFAALRMMDDLHGANILP